MEMNIFDPLRLQSYDTWIAEFEKCKTDEERNKLIEKMQFNGMIGCAVMAGCFIAVIILAVVIELIFGRFTF